MIVLLHASIICKTELDFFVGSGLAAQSGFSMRILGATFRGKAIVEQL
jgi:hypothetical protein